MFVSNDDVPKHTVDYPFVLPVTGERVWGLRIQRRNIVAWYVALRSISIYTPSTMSIAGGLISGNCRAGLTFENHVDYYSYIPEIDVNLPFYTPDELYDIVDKLPITKITQQHHVHVNKQEIAVCYERFLASAGAEQLTAVNEFIHCLNKKKEILGLDNRASFNTHVMYVLCAPVFAVYHLLDIMRKSENIKTYFGLLKAESGAAKQSQTVFRDDLAVIYELQVLYNRVYDTVDWQTEIEHRTKSKTVPIPKECVYEYAKQIFRNGLKEGREPLKHNWNSYWKTRFSSMPNGSIVSQYDKDLMTKRRIPREAKVKSVWFAMQTDGRHESWLNRTPGIYATTSTKYEWGKVRALYGCDVTSFLHADYAMSNCEDTLPSCFPVGKFATASFVEASVHKFKNSVPVCFDYDDFNSQHSIASMQAVMRAWIDTYSTYLTEEQRASAEWTHDSIENMTVNFNEIDTLTEINGTLMSGWRLTSYMNTVLNRVYLMYSGLDKLLIYSLHNGDDMFGGAANLENAVQLIKNAKDNGIRAQVSKTNLGTIGEFLRVDTRASNPQMSQYLARAISTLVHGRTESEAPTDLASFITATKTRIDEVKSRGGNLGLLDVLFDKQLDFAAGFFKVERDVVDMIINLHPVQGGINVDAPVQEYCVKRVARSRKDEQYYHAKYSMVGDGIDEYMDYVKERFNLREKELDRYGLKTKAYMSFERDLVRYETGIETDERIAIYRGLWDAWKGSGFVSAISMIRSMGVVAAKQLRGLTSVAAQLVRQAHEPMKFMAVIF